MKKRLLKVFVGIVLVTMLIGCGEKEEPQSEKKATNNIETETKDEEDEKKDVKEDSVHGQDKADVEDKREKEVVDDRETEREEKEKKKESVQMLNTMMNKEFVQNSIENTFSIVDTEDFQKGVKFHFSLWKEEYDMQTVDQEKASMSLSYDLNGEYKEFTTTLGVMGHTSGIESVLFTIYLDDEAVFSSGLTNQTEPVELSFDVSDKHTLKFEMSAPYEEYSEYINIALANAKLTR